MSDVTDSSGLDPEILELQKRLYKEQLIRQASFKKGSKFYPVNIEPFALERDRLALPFTDGDRAARKQWLHDQVLSEREPVNIPEWSRVNIFRRAYRKPYDMLTSVVEPVLVVSSFGGSFLNSFLPFPLRVLFGTTSKLGIW
ncbi:unnamed protein product [Dicrocoelium dendriticum]|nr:unnamed protein product [Dicrocoelium dendriticum]